MQRGFLPFCCYFALKNNVILFSIFCIIANHYALENLDRMKGKRAKEQQEAAKELEQSIHMVKAPAALQQEPSLTLPKIKVKVSPQQSEENRMEE